ncbi:hypothetical protein, partial [Frankia sp. CiP3]|uniref:hypothetical protein n=1 Tax=Frankia sp. CiP3 TaxID=2880971 RepID=UPI001EF5AFE7
MNTAVLRGVLADAVPRLLAGADQELRDQLEATGVTSADIAAAVRQQGDGSGVAEEWAVRLAPWLVSMEFGVRVLRVDPTGQVRDHGEVSGRGGVPELVVVGSSVPGAEHYWSTVRQSVTEGDVMEIDDAGEGLLASVADEQVFATALVVAGQMVPGSAEQMAYFGVLWRQYVFLQRGDGGVRRGVLVEAIDGALRAAGTTLQVGLSFWPAQPVVRRGRRLQTYRFLVGRFGADARRSRGEAERLVRWRRGELPLRELSGYAQDFAVITHFAEVARGYARDDMDELQERLEEISGAESAQVAAGLWGDVAYDWVPAIRLYDDAVYLPAPAPAPASDVEDLSAEDSDLDADLDFLLQDANGTEMTFLAAEANYEDIRRTYQDGDADRIVGNVTAALSRLGVGLPADTKALTRNDVRRVWEYLFVERHPVPVGDGRVRRWRFAAHPGISRGWYRLLNYPAEIEFSDVMLLLHERAELEYLAVHPRASYEEAHAYANRTYHWDGGAGLAGVVTGAGFLGGGQVGDGGSASASTLPTGASSAGGSGVPRRVPAGLVLPGPSGDVHSAA